MPPESLKQMIFPWIEAAEADLNARQQDPRQLDKALEVFLRCMLWMRLIVLQDFSGLLR